MTAAQGDVRSSLYMFPIQTLLDGKPTTWNFGSFIVRVEKSHDHFRLINTEPSGTTYVQEFELPEGETFVTNLGEHPLRANSAYEVVLPGFLSQFQSYMPVDPTPWQMEQFLLVRYGTVDESER